MRGVLSLLARGCGSPRSTLPSAVARPTAQLFACSALRTKTSKSSSKDSDDEDEAVSSDESLARDSKVLKFKSTSMRTDMIIKSALGVARNKVEKLFYESKIRLNGNKILKKSAHVNIGDEIDVIKSLSPKNPDHLYVSRVEVLNAAANEENITVTVRRFKTLLIDNYEEPYKASTPEDS